MFKSFFKKLRDRRNRQNLYNKPEFWDTKAVKRTDSSVSMWKNKNLNAYYHTEQENAYKAIGVDFKNLKILDFGCGTGRFSRWFAKKGANVTGVDFSSKSIEIAKKQTEGDNPAYKVASIFNLEEPDPYDLIFTVVVLTIACKDTPELKQALTSIKACLKPDGRLLLTEPVHKGFLSRVLNITIDEFLNVLREEGFEILLTKRLHFWPARLFLCYVSWPKFITAIVYYIGQGLMKLPLLNKLADYHVIFAKLPE